MFEGSGATSALGAPRLLAVGRRQWWVLLSCVILAAGGALVYVKTKGQTYVSAVQVSISAPIPQTSNSSSSTSNQVPGPDPQVELENPVVESAAAAAAGLPSIQLNESENTTNGDVVTIYATAPSVAQAVAGANAASRSFVTVRQKDLAKAAANLGPALKEINAEISALRQEGAQSPAPTDQSTNPTLDSELGTQLSNLDALYQNQSSLELEASPSYLQVSQEASTATTYLQGSSHTKVFGLAIVAGLLAGCGIALLREQLDDRIRSSSDITQSGAVDILARLPMASNESDGTIADNPSGQLAEAVRELRTSLRFLSVDRPISTVLVTSSQAGEGKSFVAANLAVAWAMSGARTILISSDLRAPTIENRFGIRKSDQGLSQAITDATLLRRAASGNPRSAIRARASVGDDLQSQAAALLEEMRQNKALFDEIRHQKQRRDGMRDLIGESNGNAAGPHQPLEDLGPGIDFDKLLVRTGIERLLVLPAGPVPPNPAELLGSLGFDMLLAALQGAADVIVLDSPPVLAVTDALVLTAHVDGVIFVATEGITSRSAAARALRLLNSGIAPVLGAVINRSERPDVAPHYYVPREPSRRFAAWRRNPQPIGNHREKGRARSKSPRESTVGR